MGSEEGLGQPHCDAELGVPPEAWGAFFKPYRTTGCAILAPSLIPSSSVSKRPAASGPSAVCGGQCSARLTSSGGLKALARCPH